MSPAPALGRPPLSALPLGIAEACQELLQWRPTSRTWGSAASTPNESTELRHWPPTRQPEALLHQTQSNSSALVVQLPRWF